MSPYIVGDGVPDIPQVGNKFTEVMPLKGTFLSATEINAKNYHFIRAGRRGRRPLQAKNYIAAQRVMRSDI